MSETGHLVGIDTPNTSPAREMHWAACRECTWLGPIRESFEQAQHDQDSHIIKTLPAKRRKQHRDERADGVRRSQARGDAS